MMNRLLRDIGLLVGLALAVACARLPKDGTYGFRPSSGLSAIDSLMWRQPDSAFAQLLQFADTAELDSLDAFDRNYFHLLVAELLYKNDYAQSNRPELKQAVAYYDSLNSTLADNSRSVFRHCGLDPQSPSLCDLIPFLSARAHYINGVGYYENDSAVEACAEYLKALEVMEERFEEKELVGKRAQFMALAYTHLADLFSNEYLHEQAIYFGKCALSYYNRYNAPASHKAWVMEKIGSQFEIMDCFDTASYYYHKGQMDLVDTNSLLYRDLTTHSTFLSYKTGEDSEIVLERLHRLIAQAESEEEKLVRYAFVGELFYQEKQFDSAWHYLLKEYENSTNAGLKKQAAEWLVEICEMENRHSDADEFARFLIPYANMNENQSHIKSKLTELYQQYKQKKQERQHQLEKMKNLKWTVGVFTGLLMVFSVLFVVFHFKNKRKKRHLETQMMEERFSHQMQQKSLTGRLKQKNQEMRELQEQIKQQNNQIPKAEAAVSFTEEPVCRHILSVCNDKNNPIKSTVPVSAYADIALTYAQKAELKEAALSHYGHLFERLRQQYPELKEKDFFYCYLCLLELDNVQISALMQKSISTIWDRESRLKRVFGSEDKVSVVLHRLMND